MTGEKLPGRLVLGVERERFGESLDGGLMRRRLVGFGDERGDSLATFARLAFAHLLFARFPFARFPFERLTFERLPAMGLLDGLLNSVSQRRGLGVRWIQLPRGVRLRERAR